MGTHDISVGGIDRLAFIFEGKFALIPAKSVTETKASLLLLEVE
jgi:hypothetical protein